MNLFIPSKLHLLSALLSVGIIFVILSLHVSIEHLVGYAAVAALLALTGLEYRSPRPLRVNK